MADTAFAAILVLGLIAGLRRGFVKVVIALIAIPIATLLAIHLYHTLGLFLAESFHLQADLAFLAAGVSVWILGYFGTILAGRLIWKALRGKGPLDGVENAAGGAADLAAGKTAPGPVTVMLKPIPTASSVLYWVDKVLGGLLGVAQAALFVVLVLFAATALPLGRSGAAIRASKTFTLFQTDVEPRLKELPEVQVVRSIGDLANVFDAVQEKPERFEAIRKTDAFDGVKDYPALRDLANDKELRATIDARRYADVLRHPKVIALLRDRELLRRLAAIDWARVTREVESYEGGGQEKKEPPPKARDAKDAK